MKVNLFIVGAPKAGTTSLYHYLNQHPDIVMSKEKEPDFFSKENLSSQKLYYNSKFASSLSNYHDLFDFSDHLFYGEASVSYLFYSGVAEKIKAYNPKSKIVIMLRNPIDRAFSHFLMDFRLGLVSEDFETIFNKKSGLFFQQYFELGNYSCQINRYIKVFGLSNIHIIWHSDFKSNTLNEVTRTLEFLGLDVRVGLNLDIQHNKFTIPRNKLIRKIYSFVFLRKIFNLLLSNNMSKRLKGILFNNSKKPNLNLSLRNKIASYYADEISNLESLFNKDLSSWKK
tara:strand:- start:300 stop:1151 length:852 start_codon:yes stop_codon:yes gene_type:complete